jgi:hypothetical protein
VSQPVVTVRDVGSAGLAALLARYGLALTLVEAGAPIPGSYWGECEAGLQGERLFARSDTPVHSVLHEAGHFICMSAARRTALDTDAGGDDAEECAACYLQVLLADEVAGFGRDRLLADMDAWGYSFRLGSARDWFERDAEDARRWLRAHALTDCDGRPTGACRR